MVVTTAAAIALMMEWVVPSLIEDFRTVCLNTAKIDDLMCLNGVGPKMAARIISYRKQNGPFQNPEDIMKVKGIGARLYEINYEQIIIEEI